MRRVLIGILMAACMGAGYCLVLLDGSAPEALAAEVKFINLKYSYKDFTGQSFVDLDPSEFNGKGAIIGTCLYQESARVGPVAKAIFPAGTEGIVFERCNLDNVELPVGSTTDARCLTRMIRVQNDNEDWRLDAELKPLEPINKESFIEEGRSIDPKDIPETRIEL